jgi:peptide deformylase
MIKSIVKDILFLSQKSLPATKDDISIGYDLIETLEENSENCLGMAANMIGIKKNIIIINLHGDYVVMFNPEITAKSNPYETEEGCLSLEGQKACTRYKNIEVEDRDMNWKKNKKKFSGLSAQIVQHEVDHLNGILI